MSVCQWETRYLIFDILHYTHVAPLELIFLVGTHFYTHIAPLELYFLVAQFSIHTSPTAVENSQHRNHRKSAQSA